MGARDQNSPDWHRYAVHYRDAGVVNEALFETFTILDTMHREFERTPWYNVAKAIFDRTCAGLALLAFGPVLLLVAVAVKLESPGPVLYSQTRAGRFMSPFRIYKFRTMRVNAPRAFYTRANDMTPGMFKLREDPRLTRIGRILRRWSIDELPQLINVLNGTMSLVGPRPLSLEDSSTIEGEHLLRFAVTPGITGLWQATIRESTDSQLKIRLDCEYVRRRSFVGDVVLIAKTVPTVVRGVGAW